MKLAKVEVKNYRSIVALDGARPVTIELAEGMNSFAGPNNCGKSNLIRAVALALDPDRPFVRSEDLPAQKQHAVPRITLEFRQTQRTGPEKTLFKRAEAYERSVLPDSKRSYAQDGMLRFQVTFPGNENSGATRQEIIGIRGKGNQQGDRDLLARALEQFREVVRFVIVESGSDLKELLRGKFRDVLHTVIGWHLRDELEAAHVAHREYIEGLQGSLLAPLAGHIRDEVNDLFPEIKDVELIPNVRSIEETLEDVTVRLTDDHATDLAGKGTGVRGGVLIATLRYLAEQSRRSLVFAVEEPEGFLHPAAQEDLRDDLEALAERDDVTALITTHSPYIVSREPKSQLVAIEKDIEGQTRVVDAGRGDEAHDRLLGGLFRDRGVAAVLDRALRTPDGTRGVLFVEGTTDREYLELAATVAGRPELLEGLHIVPTRGAKEIVVEAIVMRANSDVPIVILLDSDATGMEFRRMLVGRTLRFEKDRVLTYGMALGVGNNEAVEAEDLFPTRFVSGFIKQMGHDAVCVGSHKIKQLDRWHYDLNQTGKERLPSYLRHKVQRPRDVARWIELLEDIRHRMGITEERVSRTT